MAEHLVTRASGGHLEHPKAVELDELIAGRFLLRSGRIPATDDEHAAVDRLLAKNPGKSAAMVRRDPGNTGPLLVHVGDDTYLVDADGRARKQTQAA